jgi:3-dehydroquinate dehydratase-2
MSTVLLLSGPNLNLLGRRQPEVYGTATLADHEATLRAVLEPAGVQLTHVQSNREGELIEAVHRARESVDAIIINPGAFTHYAWGLHDALAAFDGPIVELHLSNPQRREGWRHTSVVAPVATAMLCGMGGAGYRLAGEALLELLRLTGPAPAGSGSIEAGTDRGAH